MPRAALVHPDGIRDLDMRSCSQASVPHAAPAPPRGHGSAGLVLQRAGRHHCRQPGRHACRAFAPSALSTAPQSCAHSRRVAGPPTQLDVNFNHLPLARRRSARVRGRITLRFAQTLPVVPAAAFAATRRAASRFSRVAEGGAGTASAIVPTQVAAGVGEGSALRCPPAGRSTAARAAQSHSTMRAAAPVLVCARSGRRAQGARGAGLCSGSKS
jgi:hypothetical protein